MPPSPSHSPSSSRAGADAGAFPRIVVNAKAYAQATGADAALALARACQTVGREAGEPIGLAPPMVELAPLGRLAAQGGLDGVAILAQHVDAHPPGAATGWTTVEALQSAGAKGSLLNHAEHKVPHDAVAATVARLRAAGLASLACADSMAELRKLAPFQPTALAIEPPQLIGGAVSVTTADPAIVRDAAQAVRHLSPQTLPLCGAGVKTADDVRAALRLGAHGVLLASGVVAAKDPFKALSELAQGLTR